MRLYYLILFFILLACAPPCVPSELYCGYTLPGCGSFTECAVNSIKAAWKGKGKRIDNWPEKNKAWETRFDGHPVIITRDELGLARGREIKATMLKRERLILWKVGQLLGYATEGSSTVYTVRRRMGDSMEEAEENHLTYDAMGLLIKKAKSYYQLYGNPIMSIQDGTDIRHSFVYEKNEKGVYVKAHWIAWRDMDIPKMKLPESDDYCASSIRSGDPRWTINAATI
ncbi:hypothetical protein APHAL10511_000319 [Amanita phalloides]|nr:hypothetical protein APHAL10511_000319 [Amanita phalloides]